MPEELNQAAVPKPPPRRTFSADERQQIIGLCQQGMGNKEIADNLGIHGHIINGILNTARRRGFIPYPPGSKGALRFAMGQASAPEATLAEPSINERNESNESSVFQNISAPSVEKVMPKPTPRQVVPQYRQPALQPSTAMPDDFTSGRPIVGASGGFSGGQSLVKYTVERVVPPDGLLGTHQGSFSVEELGQIYGEGTYKISRHEPGKTVAMEYQQKVGPSYGEARSPNNVGTSRQQVRRPFASFGRPVERPHMTGHEEDGQERAPYRPFMMYPRQDGQNPSGGDRALADFARHTNQANNSAMDKAIQMLGDMHQKSLEQIESARKSSPETGLTKFMETQQEMMNARFEQERQRELDRRGSEEEKHERQRREDRERWEREEGAAKIAHDRELARLKADTDTRLAETRAAGEERDRREKIDREERERRASEERKFLLDLEDRKMAIIRQEAEIQQKRLEAELIRSREEMKILQDKTYEELKDTRDATEKHITESNRSLTEQLERDRESLDREYKLKEKAQEREHELQREILAQQKESIQNSGGDHIFNTINTVIKEFSKGLEKVVDLKKMEAMTPEAQVAHVARGSIDGNVVGPAQEEAPAPAAPRAPAPAPASMDGDAKPVEQGIVAGIVESKMENMIRENLRKPFFQDVLKEWAVHVDNCEETNVVDAAPFANLYLEMMRDPHNDEARQGCAGFATFMKPRNWKKMFSILKDALDPTLLESFSKPAASEFYEQFRAMVIEQIKDYWAQFLAAKAAQKQAPVHQEPAPVKNQAPVEPPVQAQSEVQAAEAPPVPSRESLRAAAAERPE